MSTLSSAVDLNDNPRLQRYLSHAAVNAPYLAWQVEQFWPLLGQRILEVGCGVGGIVEQLGARDLIYGLDVEPEVVQHVSRRFGHRREYRFECLDLTACNLGEIERLRELRFDSIVCINALEHIADDRKALERVAMIVEPAGVVALLVPAHPYLFGDYDLLDGHFRRYDKPGLARLAVQAGFQIGKLRYFNAIGAIGWWLQYRVLKRKQHRPEHFRAMNRLLPVCRRIERIARPPFGLSLIAVLRKKDVES